MFAAFTIAENMMVTLLPTGRVKPEPEPLTVTVPTVMGTGEPTRIARFALELLTPPRFLFTIMAGIGLWPATPTVRCVGWLNMA